MPVLGRRLPCHVDALLGVCGAQGVDAGGEFHLVPCGGELRRGVWTIVVGVGFGGGDARDRGRGGAGIAD